MNHIFRKAALAALCVGGMAVTLQADAANWLMLQGTEPEGVAPRAKLWGFVQPTYSQTDGSTVAAGAWKDSNFQPNMIAPDLKTNKDFYLQRARFAVRGNNLPLDSKINYFLMAEMGNNGITTQSGSAVALTDASVTLNHIPHARVRVGQFKTPMSEEVYQGIMVMDYINFTNMANQQLIERFFATDGQAACIEGNTGLAPNSSSAYFEHCSDGNQFIGSVGAARDIGVQLFDTFKVSDWEHSYSLMYGNGNGINRGDNDDNKDLYLYWSSEKLFGGNAKGPWREGWKLYAWNINGTRTLLDSAALNTGSRVEEEYDRKITGVGTTFRKGKYRAAAEYITFDGMIFNGSTGGAIPGDLNTQAVGGALDAGARTSLFNVLPEEKADGWYLDFGYKVMPKLELDLRYDLYNRGTEVDANERTYETTTLGAQWFFNKKTRFIINYEIRNQDAPNLPSTHNANKIADELDNRLSMQIYAMF